MTRSLKLNVLPPPRLREECITGHPMTGTMAERMAGRARCSVWTCRQNLDVALSEDVPGRRNNGVAPEWTVNGEADAMSPSCALDVASTGQHRCSELADMLGIHKRRVQQIVKGALLKLEAAGVKTEEFMALLAEEEGK